MAIIYDDSKLKDKVAKALSDDFKHEAIKTAQEVFTGNRDRLVAQVNEVGDWERFRQQAADIRQHVLDNLDYYVREFATNAAANGYQMHFATSAEDALDCCLDIFEAAGAKNCVKSKSMMTEEIGLNDFLIGHGIDTIETDCAEHILQTAGDPPSHIVVPALHFDRTRIRDLYQEKKGYTGTESPEEITHFLRHLLREEFMGADVGVNGCNFGIAETGSTTLVSNEGNARMASTVPHTQVIFMGMERIIPDLRSLDIMMQLLARSAVGSKITSSFSLNSGPAKDGESDGPRECHIIMINNGRDKILGSEFRSMLRCIRCGACMNNCPVYRHITGHGYGSIYPGPMGLVLTPLLTSYEEAEKLPYACSLCGACKDACPVKIPLNDLIHTHRMNMVEQGYDSPAEHATFAAAAQVMSNKNLYMIATSAANPAMKLMGIRKGRVSAETAWMPVLGGWTSSRDMDLLADKKFRQQLAEHNEEKELLKPKEADRSQGNQVKVISRSEANAITNQEHLKRVHRARRGSYLYVSDGHIEIRHMDPKKDEQGTEGK